MYNYLLSAANIQLFFVYSIKFVNNISSVYLLFLVVRWNL